MTICGLNQEEHDSNSKLFCAASITSGLLQPDPERLQPLLDLPASHDQKPLQRIVGMFAYYAK